jgi:hypothetical protein
MVFAGLQALGAGFVIPDRNPMQWPMRISLVLGLSAIVAFPAAAKASCATQPLTADGAMAAEQAWVAAIEHRDTPALLCLLDPSFIDSNWKGRLVGRSEILSNVTSRPRPTLHLSQLDVTIHGQVAVVRGLNSQAGGAGSGSVRFTDVFVYRDRRWRAVAAQETVVRQ